MGAVFTLQNSDRSPSGTLIGLRGPIALPIISWRRTWAALAVASPTTTMGPGNDRRIPARPAPKKEDDSIIARR